MFNWKWYLRDIKQDKPVNVFSCFSCGGGSTMGYKRAGFQVIGNVEIDANINKMYLKNFNPTYNYNMDLRDFNKLENLPEELYHLDILDGSPPCSTFSLAGHREKAWGVKKKFREGQKEQTLDDLFFVWLNTVEKLKPKIAIAENVVGLIQGNAKGYVNMIIRQFHELGYTVQIFKLNAAYMDVPQARERVFFIGNNQQYPKLKLQFNNRPILFGEVRSKRGLPIIGEKIQYYLKHVKPTDRNLGDTTKRLDGRCRCFNHRLQQDDRVASTLTAKQVNIRSYDKMWMSSHDVMNVSTFPQDYDFSGQKIEYVCGMSVPPNMMANIALEIWNQWLKK